MTMSTRELLAIARQPTLGTPVNPSILIPVEPGSLRTEENYEQILDRGRRGVNVRDFGAYQGVGITDIRWNGIVQEGDAVNEKNILGYLIQNLLETDVYVSADNGSAGAYDHFLKVGTLKSYLTAERTLLRGSTDQRFEGCRINELTLTFNRGEGFLTYSCAMQGRKYAAVTAQTVTDRTGAAFRGWEATATVNGGSNARLLSAEWRLSRPSDPIYSANNSQDFGELLIGELEVTCRLVFDYLDATEANLLRNKTQGSLVTTFTHGTADTTNERTVAIGGALFDFGDGPLEFDVSNPGARLGLVARGLYSTANGPLSGSAQNGPVEVQITDELADEYTD